jgi:hypothetical protein
VKANNRGFAPGANVTVKLLYADASAGLPALPSDFWTAFPNNSVDTSYWKPVGNAKTVPSLSPTEPTVLEWDLSLPATAATHSCLLAVMECPSNPIPAGNKIFNVDALVRNEKRVGLKNLHVVNIPPATNIWATLDFNALTHVASSIKIIGTGSVSGTLAFLLPKSLQLPRAAATKSSKKASRKTPPPPALTLKLEGFTTRKPTDQLVKSLKEQLPNDAEKFDLTRLYELQKEARGNGSISELTIPKVGLRSAVLLTAPSQAGDSTKFSVVQEQDGQIVGGNTYVVRAVQ